jgi:4-nitrophenyl phosphatase
LLQSITPQVNALILDMDGVIWRDQEPIGDLPGIFKFLDKCKIRYSFATNNSSKSPDQYKQKLSSLGVEVQTDQIINSSIAAGKYLSSIYPDGGPVYVIGEEGLIDGLHTFGYYPSLSKPLAVVAGIDYHFTYEKLKQATLLIRSGVPFIGTNGDLTFPTPEGLIPGAGSILAAIQAATEVTPQITGKPSGFMMDLMMERMGVTPDETLVVGDRYETDIVGGINANCRTALVLSGVSQLNQKSRWTPQPDFIVDDLAALVLP